MIWTWFRLAYYWLIRLLIPSPYPVVRCIDINAQCPSCGNRKGSLMFISMTDTGHRNPNGRPMVGHTCHICQFAWAEDVVAVAKHPVVNQQN